MLCHVYMKVTSTAVTAVTPAKVTVQLSSSSSSVTVGDGSSTRLSRHTSDVSDVSTTTPVTPAPTSTHRRPRHKDDDSSSCSSTEPVDNEQSDDVWNDNPVYADRRPKKLPAGFVRQKIASIDSHAHQSGRELDHLDTTKSIVEPSHSESSLPAPAVSLQTSTSTSKSAGDIMVIIQDVDVHHGSMIDCISVAAPDDTVIKPSQLRASMRQRRIPSSSDDLTFRGPVSEIPITDKPNVSNGPSWQHSARRGGSLRETKRTPVVDNGGTSFVRSTSDTSSSAAAVTGNERHDSIGRSAPLTTKSSSTSSHVSSIPSPHRKTSQSSELEALPSLQRNAAENAASAASSVKAVEDGSRVGSLPYDELLHEFMEVCTLYILTIGIARILSGGCTFLAKKSTTFFSVVTLTDRLNIPPNLSHSAKTVLKIDSYSGWGCTYTFSL